MEITQCHRVLALTHQRVQDPLVLPLKLALRSCWMKEQLE